MYYILCHLMYRTVLFWDGYFLRTPKRNIHHIANKISGANFLNLPHWPYCSPFHHIFHKIKHFQVQLIRFFRLHKISAPTFAEILGHGQ